jgi:hypothetical protein
MSLRATPVRSGYLKEKQIEPIGNKGYEWGIVQNRSACNYTYSDWSKTRGE